MSELQHVIYEQPKMLRIMPTHLTEETWKKYFTETAFEPGNPFEPGNLFEFNVTCPPYKPNKITFPVRDMPWSIYLFMSHAVSRGGEDNVIMWIGDGQQKTIDKKTHDDGEPDIPEDLVKLINYCIIHNIEYVTFYSMEGMEIIYCEDDIKEYYKRLNPDLPVYDWSDYEDFKAIDYEKWRIENGICY